MKIPIGMLFSVKSLRKKLFVYMLGLALLIIFVLFSGLFLLGSLGNVQKNMIKSMNSLMDMYERQTRMHVDSLAMMGGELSEESQQIIKSHLSQRDISFGQLRGDRESIYKLEEALLDPLRLKMTQAQCSGAFVVLNTTVSQGLTDNRSGMYLHWEGYGYVEDNLLLYRGNTDLARARGIMPHRKWELEFQDELTDGEGKAISFWKEAEQQKGEWFMTEAVNLPKTSDQVVFLVWKIRDREKRMIGLCGYEISENYFKGRYALPTDFVSLTSFFFPEPGKREAWNTGGSLSAGTTAGYYYAPDTTFTSRKMAGGLYSFQGQNMDGVGIYRDVHFSEGNTGRLYLMISAQEYKGALYRSRVQIALLIIFLLFFMIISSWLLSRRYVTPLLTGIEKLKKGEMGEGTGGWPEEIDDLFVFLKERDQRTKEQHEREVEALRQELDRLAYDRKKEIDPDNYRCFLEGIQSLTKTERRIFDLYREGYSAKEILGIVHIKESTLRYHNQNIYGKLSVNSMKLMLRYCALMQNNQ